MIKNCALLGSSNGLFKVRYWKYQPGARLYRTEFQFLFKKFILKQIKNLALGFSSLFAFSIVAWEHILTFSTDELNHFSDSKNLYVTPPHPPPSYMLTL